MEELTKKVLARKLRLKGLSISEISGKLSMQKSGSISKWCSGIYLTPAQTERLERKKELGGRKGRIKFLNKIREEKIERIRIFKRQGLKEVGKINKRDLLIGGIAMYWSEGYTYTGGNQVGFTNSDPKMILFMLTWFRKICGVVSDRFSFQVKINEIHTDRVKKVEKYWSTITGFPISQFNKTVLVKAKSKKIYPNHDNYFGTFRITIRQGADLRRKINGWIEGLGRLVI
jgi:hypothetical protein